MAIFKHRIFLFVSIFLLSLSLVSSQQLPPDDCSWGPRAETPRPNASPNPAGARLGLKTRTLSTTADYTSYNKGKAIDLGQWFKFTCGLESLVPKVMPSDKPVDGLETFRVTVKGYVMGMRFMRDGDHDIAVELAATPDWNSDHIVVEMSAGPDYCPARKALMDLVRKDGCKDDMCIMKKPVKIAVTGFVLVGNPQPGATDLCHLPSTRGLKKDDQIVHVRGIWRLQPVVAVKKA